MKTTMVSAAFVSMCMAAMASGMPDVTGRIVDDKGNPMEFVNVVLLSLPDSTFVQGATSDLDGKFNISTPENEGLLKISSIGYETLYYPISATGGNQSSPLGGIEGGLFIQMREDSKMLTEITVRGQLPKTKLTGNSMVTSIQGSVLEKSGTAKEMLAKVPGMTQKGDDLEVLGKGAPIFYINGRKVSDMDELKRLRSEEIKEVEVITNPGAQYDATVSAVVRIKTIRRQGSGFGYDLNVNDNSDLVYGYNDPSATLNLRYRHKNVDFFGMVNYWKWDSVNDAEPNQKSYFMDNGQIRTIEQNSLFRNDWRGEGMNYNLGFNWQVAENHSIGARLQYNDNFVVPMNATQKTQMKQYLADGSSYSEESNDSYQEERDHTPYNWEGNAYYNGKVGKLGIDLNLDFLTNKTTEETSIKETRNDFVSNYATENATANQMYAGKLVLSYPIWKGQLQAGTEMTFVTRKNTYSTQGLTLPASDSKVEDDNIAAFVEYAFQLPKAGNFNVGLRYEHVGFDYCPHPTPSVGSDSQAQTSSEGGPISRYTDDFFPSLSWANQWGSWQTALSYGVKTSRPSYWMLSESLQYLNPYSLQQGDPKLKNATIQEVSANVRWKWVNLFMAYERRDDALTQWSYIYNDQGVILIKNINMEDPMRNVAAFLSLSPTWGCYSPNWTLGAQKFFDVHTLADPREATGTREVRYTQPIGYFDLNNAFRFKHSWQLECNANLMTRGDVMNYRMQNTSFNLSFVVQKCWLRNDALCLRASVNDVLQRATQKMEMDCGYYLLNQHSINNRHRLDVSLRYTFNAQQSKYKGTGAGKEAASRMSN